MGQDYHMCSSDPSLSEQRQQFGGIAGNILRSLSGVLYHLESVSTLNLFSCIDTLIVPLCLQKNMFSHSSSERSIASSLSHFWLAMLDLGLMSENKIAYKSEIRCLCGSFLVHSVSNGAHCLKYSGHNWGLSRKFLNWIYVQKEKE